MDAAPAAVESEGRGAPWWIGCARRAIGHLPAGRFTVAAQVARLARSPFVAVMPEAVSGARFWCDLTDEIARDVCLVGVYEPQVSCALAHVLAPGMTVVDAGANWGYFTLLAAGRVGPGGLVLALEPDRRMFDLLERNLRLNRLSQVRPLPIAAGGARGVLVLDGYHDGAGNRGVSRTRPAGGPDAEGTVRVPCVTLDDLLAEQGLTSIDMVKIDVEGAEDAVLEGMREGLRRQRYVRVLLELHPGLLAERGVTVEACCAPLLRAGYHGWTFDHRPAATRRAAYARPAKLSDVLVRSDRVPPDDPWPHMLWTRPDADPL